MKFKHGYLTGLVASSLMLPAAADTIYSNLKDINIPANFDGVYLDVNAFGGSFEVTPNDEYTNYDVNPFFGGSVVASSPTFQPVRTTNSNEAAITNLGVGTTVSNSSQYFTPDFGMSDGVHMGTGAGQFSATPNTEGYIGFKLDLNKDEHNRSWTYGWMRVEFSNTGVGTVKDWAYDSSGGSIVIGRVEQSAASGGTQTVTLSPLGSGEAFTLGSAIIDTGGNINSVIKTGAGTTTLSGANTYTGATHIQNGTLAFDEVAVLSHSSALNLGVADTSSGTLLYTGAVGTLANAINILGNGSDTIRNSGSGLLTLSGTLTKIGTTILLDGGSNGIALTGALVGESMSLHTLGRVSLGSNALPQDTSLIVGAGSLVALPVGSQTVAGLSGGDAASAIVASSGTTPSTLTVLTTDNTDTFTGGIGGTTAAEKNLGLTKSGAGTLILAGSAANTYTGATLVDGGTLKLNKDSNVPAVIGALQIQGGTVEIAASGQLTSTTAITLSSGALTFGSASGLTNTYGSLTNSGGTFSTGANTLTSTGGSVYWSAGSNAISAGGTLSDDHFLVTGGTNTVEGGTPRGTLAVSSGGDGLQFGGTASPTITLNSDANQAGRILLGGNVTVLSSLTSGTAQVLNGGANANAGSIDLGGATRTFNINDGSAATDMLISAAITNGGLTKAGAGTLSLSGTNTYTGGTAVVAGTLVVNGSLSTTGAVSVSGTLAGTGTVGGATTINSGATHAPGAVGEVGTQNFSGDLHYAAGSIFEWDLNASGANMAGMGYDMVGAGGAISVDTSNTVFLIIFGDHVNMSDDFWSAPWVTHTWAMSSIFGKAFFAGAFQTVQTSSPVNSLGSFTINGDSLTYSTVPEPSGVLVGLLLGSGLLRRRR